MAKKGKGFFGALGNALSSIPVVGKVKKAAKKKLKKAKKKLKKALKNAKKKLKKKLGKVSYDPFSKEIISRKATDLDMIDEKTYREYLKEMNSKYSAGTKIRSNAYPELDGKPLGGKQILEIPAANKNIPNIEKYKEIAKEYGIELRFTEE